MDRNTLKKRNCLLLMLLISNLLLAFGLFAPAMTIVPKFGSLSGTIQYVQPSYLQPTSYSIVSALVELFQDGNWSIALIVLLFSVLFPIWKLGMLWSIVIFIDEKDTFQKQLKFIENVGKASMLDIFVFALIVLVVKGMPGGTEAYLGWGVWCFTFSILIAIAIPFVLKKL